MEQKIIVMPIEDLRSMIESTIANQFKMNHLPAPVENMDEYLTIAETAKLLKVGRGTIRNYTNREILQAHKIGNRVLYKLSQVKNVIGGKYHEQK
jgi:excisionase family DNA binding protein